MAIKQLTPSNVALLQRASSRIVADAATRLRATKKIENAWLSGNRYAADAAKLVTDEDAAQVDGDKLAAYAAASVPLHCVDGWNFLSRAAEAMAKGDWPSAIHLGYYSELRAAMSLLASEGVVVLNRRHVCIDGQRNVHVIRGWTTHQFAWAALEAWRKHPSPAVTSVLDAISVDSRPLTDWLSQVGSTQQVQALLQNKWFQMWSLDIERSAADRDLRNKMSYRPRGLTATPGTNYENSVAPILAIWSSCEPGGGRSFLRLDQHLLRLALEGSYRSRTSQSPEGARFESFVERALGGTKSSPLYDFLLRKIEPEDAPLFLLARQASTQSDPAPVLARATLLLRLASAVAGSLLERAGFSREDLRFWWERYGRDYSLWEESQEPDEFFDLWDDVGTAINDLGARDFGESDLAVVWRERAAEMLPLWQHQRAALWSLSA